MSVHSFPRQRFLRPPESEIRRRVDAWRRKSVRRRLILNALLQLAAVPLVALVTWFVLGLAE